MVAWDTDWAGQIDATDLFNEITFDNRKPLTPASWFPDRNLKLKKKTTKKTHIRLLHCTDVQQTCVSCWGCSYSLLCSRIMRNTVCGCIYPGESCGPTQADLESEMVGAEDLTSKLSAFGGTGGWFRWAVCWPCGTNAGERWGCINAAPGAHFLAWLSPKGSQSVLGEHSARWTDGEWGWVFSGVLAWSKLKCS